MPLYDVENRILNLLFQLLFHNSFDFEKHKFSSSENITSYSRIFREYELEEIWKEAVVAYFLTVSR